MKNARPEALKQPVDFLKSLFNTAVAAADPRRVLADWLPQDTSRRAVVLGAGKAAGAMAAALEQHWRGPLSGLVVTRYGHSCATEKIAVVEAAHPVPDAQSEAVARQMLDLVSGLRADDLVICLLSGGGSSLLALPAPGLMLRDKQQLTTALLTSGATIDEINCVRKHLSAIKGGRLAAACAPAQVITYAISDVPGDDPAVIASGPTVADPTTSAMALTVLQKYSLEVPDVVENWLRGPASETVKPGDPVLSNTLYQLIATPQQSLVAAQRYVEQAGLTALVLGDEIEGEARDVAKVHAAIARSIVKHGQPASSPCVILSGGETTVTVTGSGRGGRNTEFLLSLTESLRGLPGVYALAADTDGIDGSEDNAGAWLTPDCWRRGLAQQLDAGVSLANNDGYGYFSTLGTLLKTGPTLTNINDFRAILVSG